MSRNPYCEKHEWPAGMGKPCPDCAELSGAHATIAALQMALDSAKLQVDDFKSLLIEFAKEGCRSDMGMADNGSPRPCASRPEVVRPCYSCRAMMVLGDSVDLFTEKPVSATLLKEAEALLDPNSPGWDAGADRLLKDLKDRKDSDKPVSENLRGMVVRACPEHKRHEMKPFNWGPPPHHPCPNCEYRNIVESMESGGIE